jgi:hypothetical protein
MDPKSTQIYARLHLDPVRESMETAVGAMLSRAGRDLNQETVPMPEANFFQPALTEVRPSVIDETEQWIVAEEAAMAADVSVDYLRHWRYRSGGPSFRKRQLNCDYQGSYCVFLYRVSELIAWVEKRRCEICRRWLSKGNRAAGNTRCNAHQLI